jgi:hypothetical protein
MSQNPKILGTTTTSVSTLIDGLSRTARSVAVQGTVAIRPFNKLRYHFQGIAPYNGDVPDGNGFICASSDKGYISLLSAGTNSSNVVPLFVIVPDSDYFHTGGMQQLGGVVAVALESNEDNRKGLVAFYKGGNPPKQLYTFSTPSKKSSATALTTYTGAGGVEYALLFVYEYDHEQMYIYQAKAADVDGDDGSVWSLKKTYTGNGYDTGDQYQNFGLVTQTNATGGDVVYLLGFREDEEVWLWTIDITEGTTFGNPTFVKKYTGWNGSDWANGVGLQIVSSSKLRIYGTDKDPSGSTTSYTYKIYIYD